jgi:hypothetical protein
MTSTIVINLIKRHSSTKITNEYPLTQITSPSNAFNGIRNISAGQDNSSIQLVAGYVKKYSSLDQNVRKAVDSMFVLVTEVIFYIILIQSSIMKHQ